MVDLWNSQHKDVHAVANLNQIVRSTGITGSQKMLEACSSTGRFVLEILKGFFQQKVVHVPDDEVRQPESHDNQSFASPQVGHLNAVCESLREETAELEEGRNRFAANSGAAAIQKLLAERLEKSRALRS